MGKDLPFVSLMVPGLYGILVCVIPCQSPKACVHVAIVNN